MKWLRRLALLVLVLIVIGAALAFWALGTQPGARFVLARAMAATEGRLSVGAVRGPLNGPLDVEALRWRDPAAGVEVFVARARLDPALYPLIGGTVRLDALELADVQVLLTTLPGAAPATDDAPFDPRPPLNFDIDGLVVDKLDVRRDGEALFAAQRISAGARWTARGAVLSKLLLRAAEGEVALDGEVSFDPGYPGRSRGSFRWTVDGIEYAGTVQHAGNGQRADAEIALTAPAPAAIKAGAAQDGSEAWSLRVAAPAFDPAVIVPDTGVASLAVDLQASGDRAGGSATGRLVLDERTVAIEAFRYALADRVLTLQAVTLRNPAAPGRLDATGTVDFTGEEPQVDLVVRWQDVVLPADLAGQDLGTRGEVTVRGGAVQLDVSGTLAIGPPDRMTDLAVTLRGTPEQIALQRLALQQPQGSLAASGTIGLGEDTPWDLKVLAERFDPGALVAGWNGRIDADIATQGRLTPQGPDAQVRIERLAGTLRERAISGSGDLHIAPDYVVDGDLEIASGESRVAITGRGGEETDAHVVFAIASLGDWLEGAGGTLQGEFDARGQWPALALAGKANGSALVYDDITAASLTLEADVASLDPPQGRLVAVATDVHAAGYDFASLQIDGDGDRARHALQAKAEGEVLDLALALRGVSDDSGWRGSLSQLDLSLRDVPPFALQRDAALSYTDTGFTLQDFCLVADGPRLCLSLQRDAAGVLQANYRIEAVPLSLLVAMGAPDAPLRADGSIDGEGDLAGDADGNWSGRAALRSAQGSIAYPDEAGQRLLSYRDFLLDAELAPQRYAARVNAVLDDSGSLQADIVATGTERALSGQVSASLPSIRFLELLTAELAGTSGALAAEYRVGGTLDEPALDGELRLSGFATELPTAGLKLTAGEARLVATAGNRYVLDGQVTSGEGTVRFNAEGGIASDAPLEVKVQGERVLAANIPGARIYASPDLTLSRVKDRLRVRGKVVLPRADIDLDRLPGGGASDASPDVVVIDDAPSERNAGLPLDVDVTVVLGSGQTEELDQDVDLEGFGLDGTVEGQLRVRQRPGREATGTGQIRVAGTYQAYGQDLKIEQGRLLFATSPLDDPGLDIRAVRELREVTPGLRVNGTAQRPVLTVFATPAMEQSEALSYLVTGRPLASLKSGEGDMVGTAARALGTATGDLLAKSVGTKLGVDDIGVSDSAELGGAAFTVGKYLSPKLYLSYGVGVFTPGQLVSLRYKLTRMWEVEVTSGSVENRAGINYRIER